MKAAGDKPKSRRLRLAALGLIAVAALLALWAWQRSRAYPSTDDASINADTVQVAAAVGGRVIEIPVAEDGYVAKGQILFRIDPVPYQLALAQAEADLALAQAQLGTQQRAVATQQSAAQIAASQVTRATANLDLADRTLDRLRPLAAKGYVPQEQLDQAETAASDAATSLNQAQVQAAASVTAIDTVAATEAAVAARQAALGIARRALDDTIVRAPHDGWVTGLTIASGQFVIPGQALFTLIDSEAWYASGNFRETLLGAIHPGECATIYSLIDRTQPIRGTVQGIGRGVLDEQRVEVPFTVPYVQRSLNWVRVEQRFPVRVLLDNPPPDLVRLGASAIVEIGHGAACR
jgi:membrane fusion protein, multidrug efflux system